uniref:Uncharacterized protein n=1 Tax=Anguilla anguilla TaxID=7936 RepID=A0A0E9W3I4_ANGAN
MVTSLYIMLLGHLINRAFYYLKQKWESRALPSPESHPASQGVLPMYPG